ALQQRQAVGVEAEIAVAGGEQDLAACGEAPGRGGEAVEGDAVFARAHAVGRDELEAFEAHAVAVEVEVELAAGEDQALVDQREHEFAALDAAAGTRRGNRAADIEAAGEAARGV